jgi:hypothetical protein
VASEASAFVADSAVVYLEVEPGDRLARHTDSAEEILDLGTKQQKVGAALEGFEQLFFAGSSSVSF